MRGAQKLVLSLVLGALLASALAACGSDGSDASTDASTAAEGTALAGSASFRTRGGDNSVQNFGEEAAAAEVDAAAAVLASYLRARAGSDWARQCAYLSRPTVEPLEDLVARSPQLEGKECETALEALVGRTPASLRANTMTDGVASLRVEGQRGFALYHGPEGVDYFMLMLKEDGEWKVGGLAPTAFP